MWWWSLTSVLPETARDITSPSHRQKEAPRGTLALVWLNPLKIRLNLLSAGCPGQPSAGVTLLTSAQAQVLYLLEGSADSRDAAWAGPLKILKGQKKLGVTVAQRRCLWRLHWEELP